MAAAFGWEPSIFWSRKLPVLAQNPGTELRGIVGTQTILIILKPQKIKKTISFFLKDVFF